MGSRQEVQEKLKVSTEPGGPILVTRRSQAKFSVAGSTRMVSGVAGSVEVKEAPSTLEVTSGYLLVQADTSVAVPDSASPYAPCTLEKGVISQASPDSAGLEGRALLYQKAKAIKYDASLLVPWDAVLLLL